MLKKLFQYFFALFLIGLFSLNGTYAVQSEEPKISYYGPSCRDLLSQNLNFAVAVLPIASGGQLHVSFLEHFEQAMRGAQLPRPEIENVLTFLQRVRRFDPVVAARQGYKDVNIDFFLGVKETLEGRHNLIAISQANPRCRLNFGSKPGAAGFLPPYVLGEGLVLGESDHLEGGLLHNIQALRQFPSVRSLFIPFATEGGSNTRSENVFHEFMHALDSIFLEQWLNAGIKLSRLDQDPGRLFKKFVRREGNEWILSSAFAEFYTETRAYTVTQAMRHKNYTSSVNDGEIALLGMQLTLMRGSEMQKVYAEFGLPTVDSVLTERDGIRFVNLASGPDSLKNQMLPTIQSALSLLH